jgi:hypothetical protein
MSGLDTMSLEDLRVLQAAHEKRLAKLPAWRWLARWLCELALVDVTAEIIERQLTKGVHP